MSENIGQMEYETPRQLFPPPNDPPLPPPSVLGSVDPVTLEAEILPIRWMIGLHNGLFYLVAYVLTRFGGGFDFNTYSFTELFSEGCSESLWALI